MHVQPGGCWSSSDGIWLTRGHVGSAEQYFVWRSAWDGAARGSKSSIGANGPAAHRRARCGTTCPQLLTPLVFMTCRSGQRHCEAPSEVPQQSPSRCHTQQDRKSVV